ncbi:MAG: hypothetical protein ABI688_09020 [Bacteroidota bacterium]
MQWYLSFIDSYFFLSVAIDPLIIIPVEPVNICQMIPVVITCIRSGCPVPAKGTMDLISMENLSSRK